jgi:hypothetical protein
MTGRTQTLRHTFLPLKSAHKSDEVFDQIARFIRNGRFQPGANPVLGARPPARLIPVGRDVLQGVGHRRPESLRLS